MRLGHSFCSPLTLQAREHTPEQGQVPCSIPTLFFLVKLAPSKGKGRIDVAPEWLVVHGLFRLLVHGVRALGDLVPGYPRLRGNMNEPSDEAV